MNETLETNERNQAAVRVMDSKERTKRLTTIAMLSAVAYILMVLSHSIPAVEGFLRYDPADIVTVIGGLIFGPMTALLISVVVSFAEFLTISNTGIIGLLMNVLSTMSFACVAAFIYKRKKTMNNAIFALAAGVVAMTIIMLLWNYIITPLYMPSISRAQVMGMLIPIFLPFNLLKGTINATITLLLYKPLVTALRRSRLISAASVGGAQNAAVSGQKGIFKKSTMIPVAVVLITCLMLLLAWADVI
jgi:riboflavin transporter FmnP